MIITKDKTSGKKIKELAIVVKVYNLKKKKAVYIKKSSAEVGAFLRNTIADLSEKIVDLVAIMQLENRKKPKHPESDYKGFYNALSDLSFGIDIGKAYMKGHYNYVYRDTEVIKGYLLFNTIGIFGMSLNVEYMSTRSDYDTSGYGEFQSFAGTIGFHVSIPISKYFQLTFAPAIGGTLTRFYTGQESDVGFTSLERKDNYLYLDGSVYLNVNLAPIQIRIGGAYKSIFMSEAMEMYTMFAGVGYNL